MKLHRFRAEAKLAADLPVGEPVRRKKRDPVVGHVEVSFDSMELPADPGLTLTVYTTEPRSPSHDALAMVASWAATTTPRTRHWRTCRGWRPHRSRPDRQ